MKNREIDNLFFDNFSAISNRILGRTLAFRLTFKESISQVFKDVHHIYKLWKGDMNK